MSQQLAHYDATYESANVYQPWTTYGPQSVAATLDLQHTIQAATSGDETAFARLVGYYQGAAERIAQHILRTEEAAADAVQEALIKAHRALPRFQEGNFRSWLLRIVTNTCYDHLRRQKRRNAISLDELIEVSGLELPASDTAHQEDPERTAIQNESMKLILAAIDTLPVWHRNVVLLIDVYGYDYAEAADMLSLPLGTIKSRLSRARATLRDALVEADMVPANMRRQ